MGSQVTHRGHLRIVGTGLILRCVNRLGSPLCNVFWEPFWISVVDTGLDCWERVWISVLGAGLDLDCANTLGSPLPLLSCGLFAILLYLCGPSGGWGLRSPTGGIYALWEPAWISVV